MLLLFVMYSQKNPIHDHLYFRITLKVNDHTQSSITSSIPSSRRSVTFNKQNIEEMLERNACYFKKNRKENLALIYFMFTKKNEEDS